MTVEVNTSGFERRMSQLLEKHEHLARAALDMTGEEMRNEAIRIINKGSRTGEVYKRGGKLARRSAPGEPPKTDRGMLVSAFYTRTSGPFTKELVNNVGYSEYLDAGTDKMQPRPFKQMIRDHGEKLLTRSVRNILKRISE